MAKQKIFLALGQRFGLLCVKELHGASSLCTCDCGGVSLVKNCRLVSGNTTSCGCKKRNVLGNSRRIHGRSNGRVYGYRDRTYGIWQAMKDRCSNPNRKDWERYGGRGIDVCGEWKKSFDSFLRDMGDAPEGKTIDRIDVNGDYNKENCRWADTKEQASNQRKNIYYTVNGSTKTVSAWAKEWGIWWNQAKRRLDELSSTR